MFHIATSFFIVSIKVVLAEANIPSLSPGTPYDLLIDFITNRLGLSVRVSTVFQTAERIENKN